ncbi:cytochrome P450 [Streptomyces sp. NPDC101455]|uniref:cytochrome P450 n=1 Tax=Streptomyces sp. NPDC101455 TaxID=3366142 RepID=UPI00381F954F
MGSATAAELDLNELPRMEWDWTANEEMDPNSLMNELRERTWVAASSRGLEVFRYEHVSRLLRDRNLQKQPQRIMNRLDEMGITEGPVREYHERSILTQDGDAHTRLRLPLSSFFAPRRAENLREAARTIVQRALARIADRPTIDVLHDLCETIPAEMFCHLVSAPPELAATAARLSDSMLGPLIERGTDRTAEHVTAHHELTALLTELVAERRRTPGDDVLSDLIEMNRAGQLTEEEVLDQAGMLLEASIDNTAHQLTWALGFVLQDQDRRAAAVAHPPAQVVEEILRLASISGAILRFPLATFEYEGLVIPAGRPIFLHLRSANRDPRVFDDPEAFRPDRPMRPGPITFGAGAHTCLGQHLARIELQELVAQFPRRFPDAELAEPLSVSYGPLALRVRRCEIRLIPA